MSIDISISVQGRVPTPNFTAALSRANERVGRAGIRAGRASLGVHRRSGATSAGLRYRTRPKEVEWYDGAPQALFLEEGTPPHIIRPRSKKALWWEGLAHPVSFVRHPGQPARPWLERGIELSTPLFERIYSDEVMGELD